MEKFFRKAIAGMLAASMAFTISPKAVAVKKVSASSGSFSDKFTKNGKDKLTIKYF